MRPDATFGMNMISKIRRWIKGELWLMRYEYEQRCAWIDFKRNFRSAKSEYDKLVIYYHYDWEWRDLDYYYLGQVRSEVPFEMRQL